MTDKYSVEVIVDFDRALLQEIYAFWFSTISKADRPTSWNEILEAFTWNRSYFVIARCRGKIVGGVIINDDDGWPVEAPCFVLAVYVNLKHRRVGLGRRMMNVLLQRKSRREIHLFCVAENAAALALYTNLGFKTEARVWNAGAYGKQLVSMRAK